MVVIRGRAEVVDGSFQAFDAQKKLCVGMLWSRGIFVLMRWYKEVARDSTGGAIRAGLDPVAAELLEPA